MPYNKSERPDSPMRRRGGRRRKKVCGEQYGVYDDVPLRAGTG